LMLHLNFTNAEKETLLIRYVQLGIDLYGVSQDGGQDNWAPDGGHASGRKWPILFAGLMLNDQAMKHIGPGDGTGSIMFGEDAQTFYVTQADIDMNDYVQTDLGLAEWGIIHATNPGVDTKSWAANYRRCCTANAWHGFVLAARMMGAQALWAHDALFDYQDRYMAETLANNDPGWMRSTSNFTADMWDTYRASLGTTETPAAPKVFPTISAVSSGTLGQTSATITWNTDLAATSRVEYGLTSSYSSTTPLNSSLVTAHLVSLNNLTPNTTYHYRLSSADASGNNTLSGDYTLTTLAIAPPADITPPSVPTNLSASVVSTTQINLSWSASTDNVGVSGYKVYRGGVQIGTTAGTTYNNTNLSASTSYSYAVIAYDAAGNVSSQSTSVSATTKAAVVTPAPTSCLAATTGPWQNTSFATQTGSFTMQFDSTPQGYPVDAVTGLSTNPAAAYNDLAVIVRFNNAGLIDVRNGSAYQALSRVSYSANTTYHFVMTVNIPQHIYSVTVAPQGGTATTLATNYAFRSTQATATTLSYLNTRDAPGPHTVCNTAVSSAPSAPAVPGSNDVVWLEDAAPAGATMAGSWNWVSSNPVSFSGASAHQSVLVAGVHQHYFYSATATMPVSVGDSLYAYVYLDPANPPTEVMLQWHTPAGGWEHRAYWGTNNILWGVDGTTSRILRGSLPVTGQWVRLEVPASAVGLEGQTVDGMAFTLFDGRATWDQSGKFHAPKSTTGTIWMEDATPTGAVMAGSWNWVSSNPVSFSGASAHQSVLVAGRHQHYFYNATATMSVSVGDTLYGYVYLDPANPPTEVMLQWHTPAGGWEHRAYWGTNNIPWGLDGTTSRFPIGLLPLTGQWVRLEVPASLVGLEGQTVDGMAFTLFDGRATWDQTGKF